MKDFWNQIPNWIKVILSSLISIFILVHFESLYSLFSYISNDEIIKQGGFWTLFSLIFSAPIAFAIWSFRDRNATDQISNARKDTNLKEYHKIVEWITSKDSSEELKISAIYYLKRFYEDKSLGFQQAALHLLLSTWDSMQRNELEKLKKVDDVTKAKAIIYALRDNGNSPLGIAITNVLLSNDGECLLAYPEAFSSMCLAGMNFYLPGLSNNIVNKIFNKNRIKYSGIQLQGCKFRNVRLKNVDFSNSNLLGTEWLGMKDEVSLNNVIFRKCDFRFSTIHRVLFENCDFSNSNFMNAMFIQGYIDSLTKFNGVNFTHSYLSFTDVSGSENFLGSIVLESEISRWLFKDDLNCDKKNDVLEKFQSLGILVLYEGNKTYNLCKLKLWHRSNALYDFSYVLKNISISDNITQSNNNGWRVQIEEVS